MCTATLKSTALPDHTHACLGGCETSYHMCSDRSCRRYFGMAGD